MLAYQDEESSVKPTNQKPNGTIRDLLTISGHGVIGENGLIVLNHVVQG